MPHFVQRITLPLLREPPSSLIIGVCQGLAARPGERRTQTYDVVLIQPALKSRGTISPWSFCSNESTLLRPPKIKTNTLDWNVMGGAFLGGAPAFVINLGGGDMAMAEQFLDLAEIDTGIKQ
jgi:hypothetical protein